MPQVVIGVVYNPVMGEMFTAIRGKGAFLNGSPIRASSCRQLGSALAITEIGVTRDDETLGALFGRISALTKQVLTVLLLQCQSLQLALISAADSHVWPRPDLHVSG